MTLSLSKVDAASETIMTPSRITEMRSAIRKISSSLCEM